MDNEFIYIITCKYCKQMLFLKQLILLFGYLVMFTQECAVPGLTCDPRCGNGCTSENDNNACCNYCTPTPYNTFNIYFWAHQTSTGKRCAQVCPPGYWKDNTGTHKQCTICDYRCAMCRDGTNVNCQGCVDAAYELEGNKCYLRTTTDNDNAGYPYSRNPCPINYYGIQWTKKCQACPSGCSACNIFLQSQMPATYSSNYDMLAACPGDGLCSYALKCYACTDNTYALVQGFCITKSRCRTYSWYNAIGGGFNSANCYCKDYYYLAGTSTCARCHYTCKTCSSAGTSACTSCPYDQTTSTTCDLSTGYNATFLLIQNWGTSSILTSTSGSTWTATYTGSNPAITGTACSAAQYVFGYYGYDTSANSKFQSAKITYSGSSTTYSSPHYGIRFRATFLFIDQWVNGIGISFISSGIAVHAYYYQMQQIIGQYLCGRNFHDHHDVIDFVFPHTDTTQLQLEIVVTHDGYAWGMKEVVMQVLKCDPSCSECDGPEQTDCTGCSVADNQVLVDDDCVCDSDNGYFNDTDNTCKTSCTTGYKNIVQRKCTPTCTDFPYIFIYNDQCVQHCPATHYKYQPTMTCQSVCYDPANSMNQYKFEYMDGDDRTCFDVCPNGYYGHPGTGQCVTECPANAGSNAGYFALGNVCVQYCDASTWAYHPTRQCLTQCPTGFYKSTYTDATNNAHNICEQECSVTLSGDYQLGDNSTGTCVQYCPVDSYADYTLHLCLAECNQTAYMQEVDDGVRIVRTCQVTCDDTVGSELYGNPHTGRCQDQSQCPENYYGDPDTTFCTMVCSGTNFFGDNDTKMCIGPTQTCSDNGFKQNDSKICVAICPQENNDGNPQFGDAATGYCEQQCSPGTYADIINGRKCVASCTQDPQTFGHNLQCVYNCSSSTWADTFPINNIYVCTTSCTYDVGNAVLSYGYNQTRRCVSVCPDTQFGILLTSTVPVCVFVCVQNTFGNPDTNLCVDQCPQPYYGDQHPSNNRTCVQDCPDGYFAENTTAAGVLSTTRLCVLTCAYGWADNYTRTCATDPDGCAEGLYTHQNNHKCVLPADCDGFADPTTRTCVPTCPILGAQTYYGDPSTSMCVLVCPQSPDYYGDNHTRQCQATCSLATQVRDPQNQRRCVTACSRTPLALFADFIDFTCVTIKNCTADTYADNHTNKCEADCQGTLNQYADEVTRECVAVCQPNYYGLNVSGEGICSKRCPVPQWADNLTVQCTTRCSSSTYGVNYTDPDDGSVYGICQLECPFGQYARDSDNQCVPNCGPGLWGNNQTRKCVLTPDQCPDGTYADSTQHNCVFSVDCSQVGGVQYYADNITQQCLSACPDNTATYFNWADTAKNLCVRQCPQGYFGYNSSKLCQTECRDSPTATFPDQYADWQLQICVQICSHAPVATFGEDVQHTCVQALDCPGQTWAEIQVNDRRCVATCPNPNERNSNLQKYADNITKTCVETCPTYFYGDLQRGWGMCVSLCPKTSDTDQFQFADNYTKTCVKVCPASQNTWGDVVWRRCVLVCPVGYFAQRIPSYSSGVVVRHCVQVCADNSWGQTIRRTCVDIPSDCPTVNGTHYYSEDASHLCVPTCPQTQSTWGQNSTWQCKTDCLTGFKYTPTRVCIDICPAGLDGDDGLFSDQGMCYLQCITADYYRDPQNARSCQPTCSFSPAQYYADSTTMKCVLTCPTYPQHYYAYDPDKVCRTDCPLATMRDPLTRKCVSTCPDNTFFDANSDSCVQKCPTQDGTNTLYFGNPIQTIPTCVIDTDCPPDYFADHHVGLCVQTCSEEQWKYGKNCVTHCPDNYYGNYDTGFCVLQADCPDDHYADQELRTCVPVCYGTFADTSLKICVNICPSSYYADPATRLCSLTCTNNDTISLHQNIANRTCISSCEQYLYLDPNNNSCQASCPDPYFADRTTQVCVSTCPSVPPLFGDQQTNQCVQQCDTTPLQYKYVPTRMCVQTCPGDYLRDNYTRFCVQYCQNVSYADSDSGYCVANCTPKYSLDDPNICTTSCPEPYYRDPTTFKCVLECPHHPVRYYKVVTASDRYCSVDCPADQFRDQFSFSCVARCPASPPTYADSSTGNCVTVCGTTYAHIPSRTCMSPCPANMFASDLTRECVSQCRNGSDTYADSTLGVPACVALCSSGTFANPYTLTCDTVCGTFPRTYGFDNTTHRICLQDCPYPYIADNQTHQCQIKCSNPSLPYLDKASKSCVASCSSLLYKWSYMPTGQLIQGQCLQYCPNDRFAYSINNSCVSRCPTGYYGDTQNNTCFQNCSLANNKFADDTTNLCVPQCPYSASYDSYGDLFSRTCVTSCPADKFTVADTNTRLCQPSCTVDTQYIQLDIMKCVEQCPADPLMFADPVSQTCVDDCSLYSERYGYLGDRTCVQQCPVAGLYADDQTRRCVAAENCHTGTYGLDPQRICTQKCPTSPDLYADPFDTHTCVGTCPDSSFAQPHSRMCVTKCPQVPSLFGHLKQCIQQCPPGYFADNFTRQCVTNCSTGGTLITYADNSTNRCVSTCPTQPNYFASPLTLQCVDVCPSSPEYFADYSTRTCVTGCPGGDVHTYADNTSRVCTRICPLGTFMQNSTRYCVTNCVEGFADPATRYCIAVCPAYTYGYQNDRTCKTGCPEQTPQLYAQDTTHLCVSQCIQDYNTYADDTTNRCVQICPVDQDLYAENQNRKCVDTCPQSPFQLADFSTRYCVDVCPTIPSLFGINDTRRCTDVCPDNSWADNQTRRCVSLCPSTPDTYADDSTWTCVDYCPTKPMTYADYSSRKCVTTCPQSPDLYADNITRRCVLNCSNNTFAQYSSRKCVETCPLGQYGYNTTHRCIPTCPVNQFADHLLHLCVEKCSVDPIYYGNPDTHICVEECPASNNSFGNPLTQQCVKFTGIFSGCPDDYFSDQTTRLCVQVCPLTVDTYGDRSTWKCVDQCPGPGSPGYPVNTFSDNSTMMCVITCPQYPEYYAEQQSRRCVFLCLEATPTFSGTFSDNSTRKCVSQCPSDPDYFSDNTTRRCVFFCPDNPLTFADYSTRRCVDICPSDPDIYGDLSTLRCVLMCPEQQSTYADYSTRLCVKVCPSTPHLFGENVTNRCVPICPSGSYADNSSRLCVAVCPEYPDTYGDPFNHLCVETCPSNPDSYADPVTQTCVLRCPDGYYAENNTRRCMPTCPHDLVNYADDLTNRCVQKCPQSQGTYGDNSTRICVTQCPKNPFTYADNTTRMCLAICRDAPDGGWADNQTRVCVRKCPEDTYGDNNTHYCVRYCPDGQFAYPVDNVCVDQCPQPYFGDNTTEKCVLVCPVSQLLFGESLDRTCTAMCPLGTYADSYTQQCKQVCPGQQHDTFAYQANRTCLQQCPIPLYGYPVTPYRCIDVCLDPYYENITDHRCYRCPIQCQVCNYPQLCTLCIPNHYLYAGRCLQSCPTFPAITYANPNRECGTAFQCTAGYYALNTTKSCVQDCPSGFYKNTTLQTCSSCIRGCSFCRNSTACITCNPALALWDDFNCYMFCSQSRRYYTTTGCVTTCPQGTYLSLTTCLPCSSICKRCVVQPQNCITCADGYYLSNNLCVSTCPNNTKAVFEDNSLYCKSCSLVDCTITPLTYQVQQYVDNYQYSFRIKFSEPINITGDISKVIKIKQKTLSTNNNNTNSTGRLLQVVYQFLDYTIYDYGNGDYVFVLNQFNASQDADLEFQIEIVDPQAIQSSSGQFPQTTRTVIDVPGSQFYSAIDYNQHIATYCAVVCSVAVLLFVLTFWNNQSIWIPIMDYFHLLFALLFINITMPPNPTYALSHFKITILTFLPNIFSSSLPQPIYNKQLSNTLYSFFKDMIFLRTLGYMFLLLIILIVIFGVMAIIWKKGNSEKMKGAKKYCKVFIKETFWKKHLHGVVYFLFMPTFLVGLMKMRDYGGNGGIQGFSIFCSFLFMVPMMAAVLYFAYKMFRLIRDNPSTCLMIQKGYQYICSQEVILPYNKIYKFSIQTNQIDLSTLSTPRINQLLILPYQIQTKFKKLQITMPLIQYFYKFMIALCITASFNNGAAQLFLLIFLTISNIIYYTVTQPYIHIPSKQYNNYLTIHNLTCFTLISICMVVLRLQENVFDYQTRVLIGNIIAGLIIYSITVNIVYFVYRTYLWYWENVWKVFTRSEMFKENYTLRYWEYHQRYVKEDGYDGKHSGKQVQFLQAIKLTNKKDGFQQLLGTNTNSISRAKKANTATTTQIKLRPNINQQLKKDISKMFKTFNQQKQHSHKSIRSSERLSKQDRIKVRNEIFGEKSEKKEEQEYQEMKIMEDQHEDDQSMEQIETQYQYEYIDEEYPEGTDINQIMKGCKKGELVLP